MLSHTPSLNLEEASSCIQVQYRPNSTPTKPLLAYFLVVKSVSRLEVPLLSLRPQVQESISSLAAAPKPIKPECHIPSALFPHAQVLVGILFSSAALAQSVQCALAF